MTAALAIITIPLLLTDTEVGVIVLLAPGVLTLAPLFGMVEPGTAPRDSYLPALFIGLIRVLFPAAVFALWFEYFDESARDGLALLLVILLTGALSLVLWAWSIDQFLTVAPYLDPSRERAVVAKRVEIIPKLHVDERRELLKSRQRPRRIARAIASTRPPSPAEQRRAQGARVVWRDDDVRESGALQAIPIEAEATAAGGEDSTTTTVDKSSPLTRLRDWTRSRAASAMARREGSTPSPISNNGAAPETLEDVAVGEETSSVQNGAEPGVELAEEVRGDAVMDQAGQTIAEAESPEVPVAELGETEESDEPEGYAPLPADMVALLEGEPHTEEQSRRDVFTGGRDRE
ncbi:MAG: hypothetical protein WEB00_05225 [Dehalococcoidia bacterium]